MSIRPTVLVVDDDEGIRDFVSLALSDEGYQVVGVPHGAAALEILDQTHPDLILLDTRMPVMSGIEFAASYRERPGPHCPILLLTAASDAESIAQQISPDAVLAKPFDLDDLLEMIEHFTSRA